MANRAVFDGLVFDEFDNPTEVVYVGDEPCYVVNDAGFRRHIPSEQVDRQIIIAMFDAIEGNEGLISEQAAKMLGQDDIFSRALIESQLKQIDARIDDILQAGIPEEGRAYLGMLGFRVIINLHGEVIDIDQPGIITSEDE